MHTYTYIHYSLYKKHLHYIKKHLALAATLLVFPFLCCLSNLSDFEFSKLQLNGYVSASAVKTRPFLYMGKIGLLKFVYIYICIIICMHVYKKFSFICFQTCKEMTTHIPGTLGGNYILIIKIFAITLPE